MLIFIDLRIRLLKLMLLLYLSTYNTASNYYGMAFTIISKTTIPRSTITKTLTATSTTTITTKPTIQSSSTTTTTTTLIRYKNNEYDDDYYPIPIGTTTFVPRLVSSKQQQQTPILSSVSTPVMSTSYTTGSTIEPYYDVDNCYYPIPIFGGSCNSNSLQEVVKVQSKSTFTAASTTAAATSKSSTIDPTTTGRIRPSTTTTKKPVLTTITKFREFVNYLDDDNRLTIVQFVAPWCKTCQKLKMNMKQIMVTYGDAIVDRRKVVGSIRFAQIEYIPKTENLITDILQIQGVPTIQMYYNTNKVWSNTGLIQSKDIIYEINNWNNKLTEVLSTNKSIQEYAISLDDGILSSAIENNF